MKYLAIALLVIGGSVGVWYVVSTGEKESMATTANTTVEQAIPTTPENAVKKSFSDFLKQTGAYKCTVEQNVAGVVTSGTVYMNAGKIKGTFASMVNGMSVNTSFILRDGFTYTWTSAYPVGFKVAVSDASTESTAGASTQGVYTWNAENIGAYACDPWTADESVFTVPTNVQFMEPGNMIPTNMGEMLNRFTR